MVKGYNVHSEPKYFFIFCQTMIHGFINTRKLCFPACLADVVPIFFNDTVFMWKEMAQRWTKLCQEIVVIIG